jgi:hypothetical protein
MSEEKTNPTLPPNVPAEARCIVCGTRTQSLQPEEGPMDGATAWYSSGNYGSRVHDTVGDPERPKLEIHVCDLCLVLHRDRVLQYDPREEPQTRGYTTWEPPVPGPDMRRRVLVVWETEDGKFLASARDGGCGSYHGLTDALEQSVERLIRSSKYLEEASTVAACRESLHKYVRESDPPVPEIVVGWAEQLMNGLAQRSPTARCWAHVDDVGFLDHTRAEIERVHRPVIVFETKVVPDVHAEITIGDWMTFVTVNGTEMVRFEVFDLERVLGLIAPQGRVQA